MKTIILNHKMNLYYQDIDKYINKINNQSKSLIIAPTSIYLLEFIKKCHHQIASQDICYIESGNNTGKVSWSQIKSIGIKYSLIGHSEKNDTPEKINLKLKTCLENNITPILCFGNKTPDEDILDELNKITNLNSKIIYAYEPVFNIGTNNIDIFYIKEQINKIYDYLVEKLKTPPHIIYGGGINENNINEIYNIKKLSGILLGSSSSNIEYLEKILNSINEK